MVSFGDSQTTIKATSQTLDIIILVWLASFGFQLHFCLFAYWARKKSKRSWVFFLLLLSFCFFTCRTLSLWQPPRPWPRYLNMCFEAFQRKWGFSHLLLTRLGLVSTGVREGEGREGRLWRGFLWGFSGRELTLKATHLYSDSEDYVFQLRIQGGHRL